LAPKYPVACLDRERPAHLPHGAEFFECDLTDDGSVNRAFTTLRRRFGDRFASCIHLAAYYDFSGEPNPLYDRLTVQGTRRILQQLHGTKAEQFIFSSTLLMMKPAGNEEEAITESSPIAPAWDYPRSKLLAETAIQKEHADVPVVILRIAGVYDEECHSIPLAQQIVRIYEKKLDSYFFPGNPNHGQPFIHIQDLTDCIERAVDMRTALGPQETFLIAEPEVVSYTEAQDLLGELIHGKEWPTIRVPKIVAKAGAWVEEKIAGEEDTFIKPWMVDLADDHYPVVIDHAKARLGWEPRHRLRDTFASMVGRLKEDPARWYKENGLPVPDTLEPLKFEEIYSRK
jgi:nucleoside-diphosphate-sugar epimerase